MLSTDSAAQNGLLQNISILFVEDDDAVRDAMTNYLSRRVNQVYSAQNGEEGLDSFRKLHPDLVISDIGMWGMNGLDMCRYIRETDPDVPFIFISAHNESEVLLSSIELGVSRYIVKPIDTDVLMDAIISVAEALEQQRVLSDRFQNMSSILHDTNYDNERVRTYVSRYLDANHGEGITGVRHFGISKQEVSGDFYSVVKHYDDLYVMLADGAGHGLSAVLPALHIPGIFKQQAARGFSLQSIAAEINRSLHAQRFSEHFVATTLIRINQNSRLIEVMNCGNPPVYIFDDSGTILHVCHSKSTALGMVSEASFFAHSEHISMEKNARIYLYTDGLSDALQPGVVDFYNSELLSLIGSVRPEEAFDAVAKKIGNVPSSERLDDVTLLELRFEYVPEHEQKSEEAEADMQSEDLPTVLLNEMTMLYVEDDDMTRDYLARYLNRRLGMVYLARNGKEGLEQFKKFRPQIILTDIKMPVMSGLEMAEEIRKLDSEVPIIVTSGSDSREGSEKMFDMGISRFHMKPLDPGKLTNTIQTCIRQAGILNQLRLSSAVFQSSSLAVITADRDKHIVDVNPAFTRITGYSLAEVFGQSPTLLNFGKQDASHYQEMWDALDENGSWSGELSCQHKNGETISEWLTVNAVTGEDGVVSGYNFIFSDISERKVTEEKVRQLALHDELTHLPNRTMFAEKYNSMLAQSEAGAESVAVAYFNIDRFVEFNNALGLHFGDELLLAFSKILQANSGGQDLVCRIGGDEFAVLVNAKGGRESIVSSVAQMHRAASEQFSLNGQEVQLRLSAGIGVYPSDGTSFDEILKSACSAMSMAQRAGGDTYRFFDKSIGKLDERQVALRQGMKAGLQRNEFYMMYQPKYSFSQQRVVGAESLVRWNHPTLGLLSPAEFIPIAESSGAVIDLSEWIVDSVCAKIAQWRQSGFKYIPVSINISPVHFWRGDLVATLQSAMKKWDIPPSLLPIEVTEGVVMDTSENTLKVLHELKMLGFHLSIDDFGTGYSSLKYLKDLPISEIKIDRSFIVEIPEAGQADDLSKTAILRTIIQLAAEFKLTVVAEGVETENQKNFLIKHGCDVIQGYLFSRPVTDVEFEEFIS